MMWLMTRWKRILICAKKKLKEIHKRQSRFNAFNFTQIYQKLTKFNELTGILTDTGHNDFFQIAFFDD